MPDKEIQVTPNRMMKLSSENCRSCGFDAVFRIVTQNLIPTAVLTLQSNGQQEGVPYRAQNIYNYDRCMACGWGKVSGHPGRDEPEDYDPNAGEWEQISEVYDWASYPTLKKTVWMEIVQRAFALREEAVKEEQQRQQE